MASTDDGAIERSAIVKMSWRILPLLGFGYLIAFIDRANISFAATQMNQDLGFSETVYGIGAGMFFLSYALFEVPSNLMLVRFGARRWLARIMISWGVLAAAMMFVQTPMQFYVMRFLLGLAEAGFAPGIFYYLAQWFPSRQRGRAISRFYISSPLSTVVMGLASGALLKLDGVGGLRGWHWLFLIEGLPAVAIGLCYLFFLPERPETAHWLTPDEREWVARSLAADAARAGVPASHSVLAALTNPVVLQLGVLGAIGIGSLYAVNLSAPKLLMAATGWNVVHVGWLTGAVGLLAAGGMLFTGALSDHVGSRWGVFIGAILVMAAGSLTLALAATAVATVIGYGVFMIGFASVTNATVMTWTDALPPRLLAVGCATANSINFTGGFIAPILWGRAKDATGSYQLGLSVMTVALLVQAAMVIIVRAQVVARRRAVAAEMLPAI